MSFEKIFLEKISKPASKVSNWGKILRDKGFKIKYENPTSFGKEYIFLKNIDSDQSKILKSLGIDQTGSNSVFVKF